MARKRRRKLKMSVKITLLVLIVLVVGGIYGQRKIEELKHIPDPTGKIEDTKKEEDADIGDIDDGTIDTEKQDIPLSFKVYNAGKGESVLVRIDDKVALIDTGSKTSADHIIRKLDEDTAGDIDYLILTSNTKARSGGIKKIFDSFNVKKVLYGEFGDYEKKLLKMAKKNNTYVIDDKETTIDLGNGAIITTYQPENRSDDIMDKSLIAVVKYGPNLFYIGSDSGAYEEKKMTNIASNMNISVYLAARRGSSKTNYLLNHITPGYVIFSKAKDEKVSDKVINRCNTKNIYKTGTCGDMEFSCTKDNLQLLKETEYQEKHYFIEKKQTF